MKDSSTTGRMPMRQHLVVQLVDDGEVELQRAVGAASDDVVVVVQDRVRPHLVDPEVVVDDPQRLGELAPDVVAVRVGPEPQLGQPLRPDHVPQPVELADGLALHRDRRRGGRSSRWAGAVTGAVKSQAGCSAPATAPTR